MLTLIQLTGSTFPQKGACLVEGEGSEVVCFVAWTEQCYYVVVMMLLRWPKQKHIRLLLADVHHVNCT